VLTILMILMPLSLAFFSVGITLYAQVRRHAPVGGIEDNAYSSVYAGSMMTAFLVLSSVTTVINGPKTVSTQYSVSRLTSGTTDGRHNCRQFPPLMI
jgi:heme/copper-type cytochrome/quinol oxidase subunit 3